MKLPAFKLERFFAQYEFKAPYLLCASDCESMSIQDLLDLEPDAAADLGKQELGYTETRGGLALREAIVTTYDHIEPDQILVHAGAEEAIFNFMSAMLTAGDHVIVHFPGYQSLAEVARSSGCEVTDWQTCEAEGWELDLDFLRQNIRSNTRAIVVNCPHNPTGYVMSRSTQQELVSIAREHNLLLFSDEVYRLLERDPNDTLPAAADLYENAVSLGVMSKTYGLAGLRIGWIATRNSTVYGAMAAFKDYTSICSSAPSEFLAMLALRHKDPIAQRNRSIVTANLEVVDRFFARHSDRFNWVAPKSGSTAFPSLKVGSAEAFCRDLVETQGVLLLPSPYYDYGDKNFRLGLGRKNLPECIEQFEKYLQQSQFV